MTTEPEDLTARTPDKDRRTGRSAARARIDQQAQWVDHQVRQAMERGEFDNLPGAGKPIENLGHDHDPDWWVKQLIEREQVSGVLPPALQLRKDDAELDDNLDRLGHQREVRAELEAFNKRVRDARRQLLGGPPVVTSERDVEQEVDRWRARREKQRTATRESAGKGEDPTAKRRWRWKLLGRG